MYVLENTNLEFVYEMNSSRSNRCRSTNDLFRLWKGWFAVLVSLDIRNCTLKRTREIHVEQRSVQAVNYGHLPCGLSISLSCFQSLVHAVPTRRSVAFRRRKEVTPQRLSTLNVIASVRLTLTETLSFDLRAIEPVLGGLGGRVLASKLGNAEHWLPPLEASVLGTEVGVAETS